MLTGELPIGRFAPPSEKVQIDVRLDEVVLRALEKEPERRYQQASEVKTDVDSIAAQPPAAKAQFHRFPAHAKPLRDPSSSTARGAAGSPTAAEMFALVACLIGGLATLMPWSSQHLIMMATTLSGYDTWHGRVTGGIFAAALIALIVMYAKSVNMFTRVLATSAAGISGVVIGAIYLSSEPPTFNLTSQQMPMDDMVKPLTDSLSSLFGSVNSGLQQERLAGPYVVLAMGIVLVALSAWQAMRLLRAAAGDLKPCAADRIIQSRHTAGLFW